MDTSNRALIVATPDASREVLVATRGSPVTNADMIAPDIKRRFEKLLQVHRGIVFKVAYAWSRSAADRDDLVQDICLQLWRSFPSYDEARSFSTWAYRVALNVAITHARRTSRTGTRQLEPLTEFHLETIAAAESARESERLGTLSALMGQLEPLNRTLMVLYLDELSHAQIAEVLGLSETNVATKISRIKNTLRGQMVGP